MALVSADPEIGDDPNCVALESQNVPRCIHYEEISLGIQNLITGQPFNLMKLSNTLNVYLENPILLDPYIGEWTSKLCSRLLEPFSEETVSICQILYQLCKICGYRAVLKFFPNSVLETGKVALITFDLFSGEERADAADWTCRYIYLLWLSLLCQSPFDLRKVLKGPAYDCFRFQFLEGIVRNGCLAGQGGKELQASSILLANIMKRPTKEVEIDEFLDWALLSLEKYSLGILSTLVQLGKVADDSTLLPYFEKIASIAESCKCDSISSQKLLIKLQGRICVLQQRRNEPIALGPFFSALQNRDTVIRWTSSKTLRRILLPLPEKSVKKVFQVLLTMLENEFDAPIEISPHALHGCLLALGQIFNYRLLKSSCEVQFVDLIVKSLKFDQIKGSYAVGSFVRDAACYVVWSLARHSGAILINPSEDHKYIAGLTCMALFDREVAGRRAASAALQEFVGRIGGGRQTQYLPILTHIHFFSVASIEKSFLANALQIAEAVPSLIPDIIDHLLRVSLFNFDKSVRKLAAKTLGFLASRDPQMVAKLVEIHDQSDDLFAMHGVLLTLSEIPQDPSSQVIEISLQSDNIPPKSLGAELLLEGYLILIAAVAPKSSLQEPNVPLWLNAIISGLKSRSEDLRKIACVALDNLASSKQQLSATLEAFYSSALTASEKERDSNYQKGLLSALATCPESFFSQNCTIIIRLLIKVAKSVAPINDIEKRCTAIESLTGLVKKYANCVDLDLISSCLICNLLVDYSIDTRGDVGSKIRFAAMRLAENLPKAPQIDNLLLEQIFGRLDKLRVEALRVYLGGDYSGSLDNFVDHLVKSDGIMLDGAFRGLIFSCGGLDPEASMKSSEIIKIFVNCRGNECLQGELLDGLENERLCLPAISTVSHLISFDCFSENFVSNFCQMMIEKVISKSSNIRKLIPAFELLIKQGNYCDFLESQSQTHKFPAIRQLIQKNK